MNRCALTILLIVGGLANPNGSPGQPQGIDVLTDETFDRYMRGKQQVGVFFSSRRCRQCRKWIPQFISLARGMQRSGSGLPMAAVNLDENPQLARRFPPEETLVVRVFIDGQPQLYDMETLLLWLGEYVQATNLAPVAPRQPREDPYGAAAQSSRPHRYANPAYGPQDPHSVQRQSSRRGQQQVYVAQGQGDEHSQQQPWWAPNDGFNGQNAPPFNARGVHPYAPSPRRSNRQYNRDSFDTLDGSSRFAGHNAHYNLHEQHPQQVEPFETSTEGKKRGQFA